MTNKQWGPGLFFTTQEEYEDYIRMYPPLKECNGVIEYPKILDYLGTIIGTKRYESNKDLRASNVDYQRGDKELEIDIQGAIGELIACHKLLEKERIFTSNVLSMVPDPTADIVFKNGQTLDVKTAPSYGKYLLVDETAHHKKKVDWYWFFQFIGSCKVKHWSFKYAEVGSWSKVKMPYGEPLGLKIA